MKKSKIPALIFFLLSFLLIMFLTFQNTQKSGELSELVLQYIYRFEEVTNLRYIPFFRYQKLAPVIRKLAHSVEYFLLGISSMLLFRNSKKGGWKAAALCAVISVSDQIIKSFRPGREFDWTDFPYDIAGYVLGIVIVLLINRIRTRRRQKDNTE